MLDRIRRSATVNLLISNIEICTLVKSGSLKSNTPIAGQINNTRTKDKALKTITSQFIDKIKKKGGKNHPSLSTKAVRAFSLYRFGVCYQCRLCIVRNITSYLKNSRSSHCFCVLLLLCMCLLEHQGMRHRIKLAAFWVHNKWNNQRQGLSVVRSKRSMRISRRGGGAQETSGTWESAVKAKLRQKYSMRTNNSASTVDGYEHCTI